MYRSKRLLNVPFATLSVLFASVFLIGGTVHAQEVRPLSVNEQIILEQSQAVELKSTVLQTEAQELQTLEQKKKELADKLATEQTRIEALKRMIAEKRAAQARATAEARVVVPVVRAAPVAYTAPRVGGSVGDCGDNQYKQYIYQKESGCITDRWSQSGCYGIGQACPASKITHCGADFTCQDAWFSNYAIQRYGSWASAYNFHRVNGWW